jgi:hypothetical protein
MDGIDWEIKSPTGNSGTTIANSLKRAVKQSENIIIDARRTKMPYEKIEKEIRRNMKLTKSIRRAFMINKKNETVDFSKEYMV